MKKIEYINQDNLFETQDMAICAYLMSLDFPLLSIDNTNPKRCLFSFHRTEVLDMTLDTFWTSQEKKFFDHIKTLKTRIYQS